MGGVAAGVVWAGGGGPESPAAPQLPAAPGPVRTSACNGKERGPVRRLLRERLPPLVVIVIVFSFFPRPIGARREGIVDTTRRLRPPRTTLSPRHELQVRIPGRWLGSERSSGQLLAAAPMKGSRQRRGKMTPLRQGQQLARRLVTGRRRRRRRRRRRHRGRLFQRKNGPRFRWRHRLVVVLLQLQPQPRSLPPPLPHRQVNPGEQNRQTQRKLRGKRRMSTVLPSRGWVLCPRTTARWRTRGSIRWETGQPLR